MIPTTATTPTQAQTVSSATIGLTSIILEGRPLSDNEFVVSNQILKICSKDDLKLPSRSNSSSLLRGNSAVASSSTYQQQYKVDSAETLHFKRLRQKLGQLRQSSPSTSRDYLVEQGIAIGAAKASNSNIDDDDDDELDQFVQSKSGSPSGSQVSESNFLSSLQSLATTCLRATPRSFTKSREVLGTSVDTAWSSTTLPSGSPTKIFATSSSYPHHQLDTSYRGTKLPAARGKAVPAKVGPHCDQFLKKIGCIKAETTEFELEHNCGDISNLNEICYRWQLYCRQISTIISKSDPVCIEIYLGPENHEILLEQWIITQKEKLTTPSMTIQSLTNAIRSQLYFSQITAWIDLIKSYGDYNREILENSRVKKTKEGSRLDIIYRIRAYDSTACFQSKPNVHNFPDVVLAENCYISVCLKSLPRMQGGIPKVGEQQSGSFGTMQGGGAGAIMAVGSGNENLSEENMVLDDRMNLPCTEKGKHKCAFDEEESNSDAVADVGASSSLSHREKQLMKYRKRMLKRDKKSKKMIDSNHEECSSIDSQMEKEHQNSNSCSSDGNSQQNLQEFASINSIRPPLYQTTTSVTESVQTNHVEMVSVSTQTASFPISFLNCDICGSEMHFVCWNCDRKFFQVEKTEKPEKPPQLGKGDLLLQAIQRTPLRAKYADHGNNNNSLGFRSIFKSDANDCQLCKRQKTQHFFSSKDDRYKDYDNKYSNNNSENLSPSNCNGFNGERSPPRDTCHVSHFGCNSNNSDNACDCIPRSNNISSDREEVEMHNGHVTYETNGHCAMENGEKSPFNAILSKQIPPEEPTSDEIEAQFKTPKTYLSPKNQLKPTPLYINNSAEKQSTNSSSSKYRSNTNGSCSGKQLPKINLSNIFSNPPSPIQISSNDAFSFDNLSPEIPVQKSNSAPTLPNSPSLSPRFLKQAAIYKRRSRHLSDRSSERSSIGSDEQISDEDLESLNSPVTSPLKSRGLMKLNLFGRRPILGSLEESLLQKRFRPKCQLSGFKVLLGASGGFCPTQLSIPASAYFYELQGQSLSTPYMCEIRLSRKGYTVPRSGTVQATLLNPLGTVVRMFVIPYDFRDMPIMSQTFIRQRILAVDSTSNAPNDVSMKDEACGITTFGEHVRSLRYAIHLRFQTSRSGRLALHTDIRFLISRRTDCDTAAAHAKGALESPNELKIITVIPDNPKYSTRQENPNKI